LEAQHHTADDILRALRMGVDYNFTIKIRTLEVVVRPLAISERVAIVNDVQADVSALPEQHRTGLAESTLLAIRTLEAATTPDPANGSKQAPMLPAALLQRFTSDELHTAFKAYNDGLELLDPGMETLKQEQLDALVQAAKKNSSALKELPRPHLESLARYLLTRGE